jgi:AcrR family transcriptional regulator
MGYEQTTFKDIGHAAGMTRTALYSYFDTKADLYLATLIDIHEEFLPDFLRTMEECKTLRERFKRIVMSSTAAHARDSNITGFLSALPIEIRRHPELNAVVRKHNTMAYQAMAAMFDEAKRNGEISTNASTVNLVSAFFGGALGVGLFHYGMQAYSTHTPSLNKALSVYVSMSEGKIFAAR